MQRRHEYQHQSMPLCLHALRHNNMHTSSRFRAGTATSVSSQVSDAEHADCVAVRTRMLSLVRRQHT
jgi:hypothetical protein